MDMCGLHMSWLHKCVSEITKSVSNPSLQTHTHTDELIKAYYRGQISTKNLGRDSNDQWTCASHFTLKDQSERKPTLKLASTQMNHWLSLVYTKIQPLAQMSNCDSSTSAPTLIKIEAWRLFSHLFVLF